MAPHSSTLAWKIPWMEEPGGLQSMGLLRVGHDWTTSLSLLSFMHWRRKWQPTPVFLPGESQGRGSLVGWRLWGRTESDTTEQLSSSSSSSNSSSCHFFSRFFFWMWTIFKVFIEFVTILLLCYFLVVWPWSRWDLTSLDSNQTHTPCIGSWSLNHWATREVPMMSCKCVIEPLFGHNGNIAGEIGKGKGNGELIPSVSASLACEFFNYYTAVHHFMSCEAPLNCPLWLQE